MKLHIKKTWQPQTSTEYAMIPGPPVDVVLAHAPPRIDAVIGRGVHEQINLRQRLDAEWRKNGFRQWKESLLCAWLNGAHDRFAFVRRIVAERMFACSGVSAGWCPVCGDCICEREDGGPFEHHDCPLHAPDSPHAQGLIE